MLNNARAVEDKKLLSPSSPGNCYVGLRCGIVNIEFQDMLGTSVMVVRLSVTHRTSHLAWVEQGHSMYSCQELLLRQPVK